jgi:hypothetical protein
MVNRTQGLVVGFFLLAWASLLAIYGAAPAVYDQTLKLPPEMQALGAVAFLAALSVFLVVLSLGVLRRWRWAFWLIMVAFLAGVVRVPAAVLELAGVLPVNEPSWYIAFQGLIGVIQLVIGLAMLTGYRRAGIWGKF